MTHRVRPSQLAFAGVFVAVAAAALAIHEFWPPTANRLNQGPPPSRPRPRGRTGRQEGHPRDGR